MKTIIKMGSFICLVLLIGIFVVSCKHLVTPLDGPGMERDPADYASDNDDSLNTCNTDSIISIIPEETVSPD